MYQRIFTRLTNISGLFGATVISLAFTGYHHKTLTALHTGYIYKGNKFNSYDVIHFNPGTYTQVRRRVDNFNEIHSRSKLVRALYPESLNMDKFFTPDTYGIMDHVKDACKDFNVELPTVVIDGKKKSTPLNDSSGALVTSRGPIPSGGAGANSILNQIRYYGMDNPMMEYDSWLRYLTYHEMAHLTDRHSQKGNHLRWLTILSPLCMSYMISRKITWIGIGASLGLTTISSILLSRLYLEPRADYLATQKLMTRQDYDSLTIALLNAKVMEIHKDYDILHPHPQDEYRQLVGLLNEVGINVICDVNDDEVQIKLMKDNVIVSEI